MKKKLKPLRIMTRTANDLLKVLVTLELARPYWLIRIRRTYAGSIQRAMGAWVWWADRYNGKVWREICGSIYPCKEIIKAFKNENMYVDVYHSEGMTDLFPEKGVQKT